MAPYDAGTRIALTQPSQKPSPKSAPAGTPTAAGDSSGPPRDLQVFLARLRAAGDLVEVETEVDPDLEIAEIHRRVIAAEGPALLFRRVKGSSFPVATNLFGSKRRVDLAFGPEPERIVRAIAGLPRELLPPTFASLWKNRGLLTSLSRVGLSRRPTGRVTQVAEEPPNLASLPALKTWPRDGGRFLTLGLVHTEHPETAVSNLGVYRMQVFSEREAGMHVQIGKGGGFHLAAAERLGRPL